MTDNVVPLHPHFEQYIDRKSACESSNKNINSDYLKILSLDMFYILLEELDEINFDLDDPMLVKDLRVVFEFFKASLYRYNDAGHPFQDIMDSDIDINLHMDNLDIGDYDDFS